MITDEVNADGPGIVYIGIFFCLHNLTNLYPGSEMRGVPASEINATDLPSVSLLRISFRDNSLLKSLYMNSCFLI